MLIAAAPSAAAIAHVQTVSCIASASATCTTSPVTTTTGNLFVATASYCCAAFTSITDSPLNTYGIAVAEITDATAAKSQQRYVANGTGSATHTFTLTGASGSFFGTLSVSEISGAASSPLDQTSTALDVGSFTHTSGSTPTTAQAAEILVGWGAAGSISTNTGPGGSWVDRTNVAGDANTELLITGTQVVSSIGTYAYGTWTSSGAITTNSGISTWKEANASRQRCIGCGTDKKVIGE